jgi:hypothetical protein
MRLFFIMTGVTPQAVPFCLLMVMKSGTLRMTGSTGLPGMNRISVRCRINQRKNPCGRLFSRPISRCVTMKAESLDLFPSLVRLRIHFPVTRHAGLIFRCKGGQFHTRLMAGPALLFAGNARLKRARSVVTDAGLSVGFVTPNAIAVFSGILNLFATVFPCLQVLLNFIMAGNAGIRREKIPSALFHLGGVRVYFPVQHITVAVLAGSLAVGRDMVFPRVDEPGSLCFTGAEAKSPEQEDHYCPFPDQWITRNLQRSSRKTALPHLQLPTACFRGETDQQNCQNRPPHH